MPLQGGAFQPGLGGDLLHGEDSVPQQGGVFELVGIDHGRPSRGRGRPIAGFKRHVDGQLSLRLCGQRPRIAVKVSAIPWAVD